ncbi:zf-HC2 domain-containing protein [Paenibacillus crassostreae]|uniref:Anti-sigma-W factor RsiW n=1 Tax=Paenibacillus crassostreae TaxID=1763538 RepID=A0A167EWK7_9BACL|nr:zf-HC2 domain-containing protein [Paenibacillus crassostreae]AOZ93399.1 anti-sigma factor [Paenibacillus crassostreae]OAB75948.1 anti-sigma factor [Paenibacillus crassostreae]
MDCKLAVSLMHDYLDDDLAKEQNMMLKAHLQSCADCHMRFKELEQTEMALYSLPRHIPTASKELTERILNTLPKHKEPQIWVKWMKRHPAATAAALFLVVMLLSVINVFNQDSQLVVQGNNLDQIVIEGNTVIVPEGNVVSGDLTIENGKAEIFGDVEGNLTVIDGSLYTASTAQISGQVKSVDQALDWIWFKLSNVFSEIAYR